MLIDPILDGLTRAGHDPPAINPVNTKREISKQAALLREEIRNEVAGRLVCLKLDAASRLRRHLLSINIQYAHNGKLVLRHLEMLETFKGHTSEFLAEQILKVLGVYGIDVQNVYSATVDNGANMKKAVKLLPSRGRTELLDEAYRCCHFTPFPAENDQPDEEDGEEDDDDPFPIELYPEPEASSSRTSFSERYEKQTRPFYRCPPSLLIFLNLCLFPGLHNKMSTYFPHEMKVHCKTFETNYHYWRDTVWCLYRSAQVSFSRGRHIPVLSEQWCAGLATEKLHLHSSVQTPLKSEMHYTV